MDEEKHQNSVYKEGFVMTTLFYFYELRTFAKNKTVEWRECRKREGAQKIGKRSSRWYFRTNIKSRLYEYHFVFFFSSRLTGIAMICSSKYLNNTFVWNWIFRLVTNSTNIRHWNMHHQQVRVSKHLFTGKNIIIIRPFLIHSAYQWLKFQQHVRLNEQHSRQQTSITMDLDGFPLIADILLCDLCTYSCPNGAIRLFVGFYCSYFVCLPQFGVWLNAVYVMRHRAYGKTF